MHGDGYGFISNLSSLKLLVKSFYSILKPNWFLSTFKLLCYIIGPLLSEVPETHLFKLQFVPLFGIHLGRDQSG